MSMTNEYENVHGNGMAKELISVLIPCFNQADFLHDCLNSIMGQETDTPTEIIVLDDGSDEDVEAVCKNYTEVRYIRQEHMGVSAARNRLLAEAKGEYISFADADDIFAPDKLRLQLRYLRNHPDCPFVGCNVVSFYGSAPSDTEIKKESAEKFLIPCLIRKSIFDKTGPFDESISVGEDTEYLIRMKRKGICGAQYLKDVLYYRRLKDAGCKDYDREKDLGNIAASIKRARKNASLGPEVSMIVPCYNSEKYIDEFLQSVLSQTYRPIKLILVDDGSSDHTREIIKGWLPKFEDSGIRTKYIECPHRNQSSALNEGLKYCSGEYITWADSDDILHPENVEAKVAFLEKHPEIGMVRNEAAKLEDGCITVSDQTSSEETIEDIFERVLLENIGTISGCFMLRFSLFLECWEEREITVSSLGQNIQLVLPASGRSLCGYIPEALMTYRIHEDSHSMKKRTFSEVYERIEELRRVLKEAIYHSGRNEEKYIEMADARCDKLRQSLVKAIKYSHKINDTI